jgi:hypothetical protein
MTTDIFSSCDNAGGVVSLSFSRLLRDIFICTHIPIKDTAETITGDIKSLSSKNPPIRKQNPARPTAVFSQSVLF